VSRTWVAAQALIGEAQEVTAMETLRLRGIQHPSHVGRLLEELVSSGTLLPKDGQQVHDPDALPRQLRELVGRAAAEGRVWACWGSSQEIRLFTCEMSLPLSRERGTPVLLVNRYDDCGELKDVGTWVADPEGKWRRFAE
jgi:hypothetical protein